MALPRLGQSLPPGDRRRARWRVVFEGLARLWRASEPAGDHLARREELESVRQAIEDLTPVQRSVVVMRYYCELDSHEIGEILQLSHSTVRSHLRLARQRLAESLKRLGYDHDQ
jgi:RNA polymerase sigma factor (sigma-70 family)